MTERPDRRRSPRIPCDLAVEYAAAGARPQEGRIANIGTLGILLMTKEEHLPVGTGLRLRFQLPLSQRPIQTQGTVRWATAGKVGVEFLHLDLQQQDEIWRYYAREAAGQRKKESWRRRVPPPEPE